MNRLPHISIFFAAALLVAADKPKEPAPSPAQIQQWVKQLGDIDFKVREEATRNLLQAGRVALGAVTTATKSEDAEVKQRALRIVEQIRTVKKQNPGPPKMIYVPDTKPYQRLAQFFKTVQDKNLQKNDPHKVKSAIQEIVGYGSGDATFILVENLDFEVPTLAEGIVGIDKKFPSIKVLTQIGEPALPMLADAVALKNRSGQYRLLAKMTINRIKGGPEEGRKYIQQRAEMHKQGAQRLEELMPKASNKNRTARDWLKRNLDSKKDSNVKVENPGPTRVSFVLDTKHSKRFNELVNIIEDKKLEESDQDKVASAIQELSYYGSEEAILILVEKLEFTLVLPRRIGGLQSLEEYCPALKALNQIGDIALPVLADAVALKKRTKHFRNHAEATIIYIKGGKEEGHKYIRQRAEFHKKAAQRLEELLPKKSKAGPRSKKK